MTALDLRALNLIGKHVYLEPAKGLQVRCRVTDVKVSYGHPRVRIEALEGSGEAWVAAANVTPCYDEEARA
jgi:hypothetical protein